MFDDLVGAIIGWMGAGSARYSKKGMVIISILMGVVFFITSIIREWLFYSDNPMSFMDYMVLAVFFSGSVSCCSFDPVVWKARQVRVL